MSEQYLRVDVAQRKYTNTKLKYINEYNVMFNYFLKIKTSSVLSFGLLDVNHGPP